MLYTNNVPVRRNYNKANYDEARRELENFDWISHLSNYDVNKKWVLRKSKLKEIEEKCVPIFKNLIFFLITIILKNTSFH